METWVQLRSLAQPELIALHRLDRDIPVVIQVIRFGLVGQLLGGRDAYDALYPISVQY